MEIDDPLERTELTFLLGMAFQLVLSEFVDRLDAVGYAELRPMHGLVFQALRGPGATTSELAEQLGVTKQAAGQIVDDLEKRGYVERRPHPAGGRRRLVVLTSKALEHLSVAGRILHELEAQLARRLHEVGLRVPRAEITAVIRALAGDSIPPLRPIW
ncbi:MarR family winged helix-turn-helix transcriptional regulator [Streptomyces botrytidirepellens]|uniref:MarR family transcriptional regulator n=1 Tax=Streptomyces botrytidirepellens TaxID=2486417 RepID=A0A3M8VYD3_9ACTN|nr:MarR family transcriptional regulator [Streptomyces botrytidirepellens]RNG22157.1 MarR family transcriptional regulator [Streptomyces botrytidirepellens]